MKRFLSVVLSLLLTATCFISVSATTLSENPDPSDTVSEDDISLIYQPKTALVDPPLVIELAKNSENLEALEKENAPQGIWLDLGSAKKLNKLDFGGEQYALTYVLSRCKKTIPILEISNTTAAEKICNLLIEEEIHQVIIASKNTKALKYFTEQTLDNVTLAYIVQNDGNSKKIAKTAQEAGANICVFENVSRKTAEYLQSDSLDVFVFKKDAFTRDCIDAAANCGAGGVVVPKATEAYNIYKKVKTKTHIRQPINSDKKIKFKTTLEIFGDIEATEITLNKTIPTIKTGKTLTLKATITPANTTNKKLKWTSSDKKIATVDQNGVVTAHKKGSVVITAQTVNGVTAFSSIAVEQNYTFIIILIIALVILTAVGAFVYLKKKPKLPKFSKAKH